MKSYFSTFRMRWKMETQYRGAALGGLLCQLFFGLILVALYRALYAGKPQSTPLSAVTTYVWLQQAFFRMIATSDGGMLESVMNGGVAYELCRPLNLYGYYYSRALAQKIVGCGMRAAPMLICAALLPQGWGLSLPASPAGLALSLLALGLGLFCVCALDNINMGFTMRTLDNKGVSAMLSLLAISLSGNLLPLTLFPDSWQRAVTLLPYAQMLDAPIRLYTGERALSQAPRVLLVQAGWTAALIALGLLLWKRNLARVVIQGG